MADIEGFRAHAVVDGDQTDDELELYLNAAIGYLDHSGVTEREDDALYDLACYQVATHYLERKGMVGDPPGADPFGVQGIIHQLKDH